MDELDIECFICTNEYHHKIRPPVEWKCCRQWMCRECAVSWLESKGECPLCRNPSTISSFEEPSESSLLRLFNKLNVGTVRNRIAGFDIRCSCCNSRKISFEQLSLFFSDAAILGALTQLPIKEKFTFLLELSMCSPCFHQHPPPQGVPLVPLQDVFFVSADELRIHSLSTFQNDFLCDSEVNAMKGALVCWRWMYALECGKTSEDDAGIFYVLVVKKSEFWRSLESAPRHLWDWIVVAIVSLVKILALFTKKMLIKTEIDVKTASEVMWYAADLARQMATYDTLDLSESYKILGNVVLYPTFKRVLEQTTEEKKPVLEYRYTAIDSIVIFEGSQNNIDASAYLWELLRTESVRIGRLSGEVRNYAYMLSTRVVYNFSRYLRLADLERQKRR